jgi:hypothetical protein
MRSQWNGIKRFTLTIAFSRDTKMPALRKRSMLPMPRITSGLNKDCDSDRSGILTYPPERKTTLWSRLFRAITTRAADLLAKILAELTYNFFWGK